MERLKIAIVGMGQRACFHGGLLFLENKDEVEMVAVCDNRQDRLDHGVKAYSEAFENQVRGYLDYNEMYEKEELDGVFIASPNNLHFEMTIPAFEKGINVLCEKPMELTLEKCDKIIAKAKETGKVLSMAMQMHYRARYHKIKELIEQGAIGTVAQLWCTEYRGPYGEMKDWVWDKEKSGGAIFEKNCHHYDLLNWWADSVPTTVYASGNIIKHHKPWGFNSNIVDNAWVINDYESGARAMLGINFMRSLKLDHKREFGIIGTEGNIFFNLEDGEIVRVERNNKHKELYDMRDNQWIRGGLTGDFLNCIRTGKTPLMTGEMAKDSLLVPMAAEKSIDEKRIVHVNEFLS